MTAIILEPHLAALPASRLPDLPAARCQVVQRADATFGFLHDAAITAHSGVLHAAWYNCPQGEIVGASCIRGRRSHDGGATWSAVETIAADTQGRGIFYVPIAFHADDAQLRGFICTMSGHDRVTGCDAWICTANGWQCEGRIADHFLPNCAPIRLADGTLLMAGRMAERADEPPAIPAVALGDPARPAAPWTVVPISAQRLPLHPETTVWVEGTTCTALVRGGLAGGVWLYRSDDSGRTWSGPHANNLPAGDSKLYAGHLSTGQRYLVWNWPPQRDTLVLAVSRPGETRLSAAWRLRHGPDARLNCGPEWSYPCAHEHDGRLLIACSSEKRHAILLDVPLAELRLNG